MDEAPTARKFVLRFLLVLAGMALVLASAYLALRPPRLVWGSWFRDPTVPRDHMGYATFGASDFEDFRLRLSGKRIVFIYVPPDGSHNSGWPRLTGRNRPIVANQGGEEEIELYPP